MELSPLHPWCCFTGPGLSFHLFTFPRGEGRPVDKAFSLYGPRDAPFTISIFALRLQYSITSLSVQDIIAVGP